MTYQDDVNALKSGINTLYDNLSKELSEAKAEAAYWRELAEAAEAVINSSSMTPSLLIAKTEALANRQRLKNNHPQQ